MSYIPTCARAVVPVCLVVFATAVHASQASKGFSELYAFCQQQNCSDGQTPDASLIADGSGNLYGTTAGGGANGGGTVFEIKSSGKEKVLYSFCAKAGCADGQNPLSNLIRDKAGNLYGTTFFGGASNGGTVFELAPGGTETVLYSFCNEACKAGQSPTAGLVRDAKGNLYGTTTAGGANDAGVVFRLAPDGHEKVLYSFCGENGCTDGEYPSSGLLMKGGKLYGTTSKGGTYDNGTVFRVTASGGETVLYSFCNAVNCPDGGTPAGNVVEDKSGNLYGTTEFGGANGAGAVFELTPAGSESLVYSFGGGNDGGEPVSGVLLKRSKSGLSLYGTTPHGGAYGDGVVFGISNGAEKVLHAFPNDSCANPAAGVILLNHYFYGTSAGNNGCVFRLGTQGGARE